MWKKYVTLILIILFSLLNIYSKAQNSVDFSKYKISSLSKSTKGNCSAFRLTIPIDFNNDGSIDFVTTGDDMGPCGTNGEISYLNFFENDGKDNYTDKTAKYAKDSLWVIRPNWFLVEDFNGDGKKDIFITGEQIHAQWNSTYLKVYPFLKPNIDIDTSNNFTFIQRRHHIYLSQADGTYKDSPDFLQGMRLGSSFGITAVDYNKDGYIDLVNAVQQFSNNDNLLPSGWDVEFFINNGGKSMTRSTPFTVRNARDANNNTFNKARIDSLGGNSEGPENIKLFDVNNDGYYDLIFNDRDGNALCMLSQNKFLDLYSPIIKFDDYQTNDLLTNMPGSKIQIRGFYITDIKNDGTNQLIEYWANGGGDFQPDKKLYQLIKIFDIKNGNFVDATNNYFIVGENISKTYGSGLLGLVDIDNDGFVDLYPKNIDHDGVGWQGFNGNDSTVYFKNSNGKFSLKSMGLKYYFKEFKELADSMKIYKYDTVHKFSIANNLIPINTGKTNKLIFYSYGTDPGMESDRLKQYPNQFFFNLQNKVRNDSLSTSFKGFILAPDKCINTIKPAFNSSNYTFCYGDSLKVSITNVNKGDSIKWYYSTRRDFTNISSKYFYDSTKLYVLRTDSNGCSISSDTIFISVKDQPQFRILGNQSLAYNKDTTRLFIKNESKRVSGNWYFNNTLFSDKDSVILKNLGEYKYVQTDSNGCINTEKFILKKDDQIGFRLRKFYFDIKDNITGGAGVNNSPAVIVYNVDSTEHIIHTLATSTAAGAAPLHFYKKNGAWTYEGLYKEGTMSGGARNFSIINNTGEIAIASTGTEAIHPWPLGDIFTVKTIGEKLKWKKLNIDKSFYHSVATGDLNNDGLSDVVGLHMGTYGNWWGDGDLHTYLLNKDSNYSEGRSIINFTNILDNYQQGYGSAVLIDDIDKDNKNELIKATYNDSWDGKGTRYGMLFFKFDSIENKIKYYNQTDQLGIFRDGYKGATSLKTVDIDNDGDKDIVVVIEGPPGGGVQIWLNDGKGNFSPGQLIYTYTDEYGFREFELADINKDGFVDLILHPSGGNKFRINPRPHDPQTSPWGYLGDGFMLQSSIFLNNKGKFTQLNADISIMGLHPDFMKGYFMNNKLKFIGFEEKTDNNNPNDAGFNNSDFYLYEVELTFCKNLIKPTFNTSNFSFCTNDSLKLSITNRNLGDTLRWYYGSNADTSSSKIFKESSILYVIRTDSLGCKISSDTITITKNPLPTIPIVKDTIFCQNINSSTLAAIGTSGNTLTWYGTNAIGGTGSSSATSAATNDTALKSYYVTQINNTTSCESPRAKITVKINPAPVNPIVRDTAYCNNISADTLKAVSLAGHTLSWYGTNATGGTGSNLGSKPITSTVGNFSYYVSQINTATGCEGARAKIGVTINPLPAAPIVKDTAYCNNASSDTIRVTASTGSSLLWYGTNATGGTSSTTAIKPSTSTVGTANYYLSQMITATGCEGPRSKITVTTKPIPTAPSLVRDTANYLLSGASGTTWYKDGNALSDTAQKYKPTTPGSYTAKTTLNGCTSVMSAAYYYLVTDIINLSKDEYIKLAPNPFINQLNFDFVVKGYQRLNIEVFDVATGNKVASQPNLTAGSRIALGQLAGGTYIIRVTSNDNKIVQQFKVVKM